MNESEWMQRALRLAEPLPPVTFEPCGIYTAVQVENLLQRTLFREVKPHLRPLVRGRYMGSEILRALQQVQTQEQASAPAQVLQIAAPKIKARGGKANASNNTHPAMQVR